MYIGDDGLPHVIEDKCTGCGKCAENVCFVNAIQLKDNQAYIDQERCRGCGHCASICPENAINIIIENSEVINDSIKHISNVVEI